MNVATEALLVAQVLTEKLTSTRVGEFFFILIATVVIVIVSFMAFALIDMLVWGI